MARLPQPGGDEGDWGDILNDYLLQSHASDGTLKSGVVGTTGLQDGSVTEIKLGSAVAAKINDTTAVDAKADKTTTLTGSQSITGGGDLSTDRTLSLVGDDPSPANDSYYGTDGAGAKGFHSIPAAVSTKADKTTTLTGSQSITGGGDLSTDRTLSLVGDTPTPANNNYYGTDGTGTKGFYSLPSAVQSVVAGTGISVDNTDSANPIVSAAGGVLLLESGASVPPTTPVNTIIFEKVAPAVIYDFTAGALPAGWSKHGTPTETFSGAGMATTFSSGQGYHIDTIPSGNFSLELAITALGSTGTMFGPTITTAAGSGVGATWYNSPSGLLTIGESSWAYASSYTNAGGAFAVPCRIRLTKVGTSYTAAYSFNDGATWSAEGPVLTNGNPMTRLGISCAFSGTTATITQAVVRESAGTGVAQGWWDGSAIQPLA